MINKSLKNKTSQITTGDAFADYLTNIQHHEIVEVLDFVESSNYEELAEWRGENRLLESDKLRDLLRSKGLAIVPNFLNRNTVRFIQSSAEEDYLKDFKRYNRAQCIVNSIWSMLIILSILLTLYATWRTADVITINFGEFIIASIFIGLLFLILTFIGDFFLYLLLKSLVFDGFILEPLKNNIKQKYYKNIYYN